MERGEGEVRKGGKEGESPYLQNCKMESEELKKKKSGGRHQSGGILFRRQTDRSEKEMAFICQY